MDMGPRHFLLKMLFKKCKCMLISDRDIKCQQSPPIATAKTISWFFMNSEHSSLTIKTNTKLLLTSCGWTKDIYKPNVKIGAIIFILFMLRIIVILFLSHLNPTVIIACDPFHAIILLWCFVQRLTYSTSLVYMLVSFVVNSTLARAIWKHGTSIEKMHLLD